MPTYLLFGWNRYEAYGGMRDCIGSFVANTDEIATAMANEMITREPPYYHHYEIACVHDGEWRYLNTVVVGIKLEGHT